MKALLALASMLAILSGAVYAQDQHSNECAMFRKNSDGSWSPKQSVTISNGHGNQVTMGPGVSFRPGVQMSGIDVAAQLEADCKGKSEGYP